MPLISLIIPVYHAERYLRQCLDSVAAQTLTDFEAILVDDGSTDSSGAICDEYAAADPRFRVIHQKNGGVSRARNQGMELASGEYVLFLDADDLWVPTLLEEVALLISARPDMGMFSYERFDDTGFLCKALLSQVPEGESGEQYLHRLFAVGATSPTTVWSCAYRRQFLAQNELRFREELTCSEDFAFQVSALSAAASVQGTERILYRYRMVDTSLSHRLSGKKVMDNLTTKAEAYRRYPTASFANLYTDVALLVAKTEENRGEILAFLENNRDIFASVSQPPLKLAVRLFSLFGYVRGSQVFYFLQRCKRRLQGCRN